MEAKQNQTLDENNLKLNKEQKQILKKVMILVRESLFEEETSDAKDCILEFSSCIMKNEIINKRKNLNSILQEFVLTKIDGSEGMGSVDGNAIQKQTLLKICELEELASKPSSFFSSGKKGKKGSVIFKKNYQMS